MADDEDMPRNPRGGPAGEQGGDNGIPMVNFLLFDL